MPDNQEECKRGEEPLNEILEPGDDTGPHPPDDIFEQYHLGMIADKGEQAIEEHLLVCPTCAGRVKECADYVDEVRRLILEADVDQEFDA